MPSQPARPPPGAGSFRSWGLLGSDGLLPFTLGRELGRVTSLRRVDVTVRPHFEGSEDAPPCLALAASLAGLTRLEQLGLACSAWSSRLERCSPYNSPSGPERLLDLAPQAALPASLTKLHLGGDCEEGDPLPPQVGAPAAAPALLFLCCCIQVILGQRQAGFAACGQGCLASQGQCQLSLASAAWCWTDPSVAALLPLSAAYRPS